jgi:hypothetical protein
MGKPETLAVPMVLVVVADWPGVDKEPHVHAFEIERRPIYATEMQRVMDHLQRQPHLAGAHFHSFVVEMWPIPDPRPAQPTGTS